MSGSLNRQDSQCRERKRREIQREDCAELTRLKYLKPSYLDSSLDLDACTSIGQPDLSPVLVLETGRRFVRAVQTTPAAAASMFSTQSSKFPSGGKFLFRNALVVVEEVLPVKYSDMSKAVVEIVSLVERSCEHGARRRQATALSRDLSDWAGGTAGSRWCFWITGRLPTDHRWFIKDLKRKSSFPK